MKPLINRLTHNVVYFLLPFTWLKKRMKAWFWTIPIFLLLVLASCFQHYYRPRSSSSIDAPTIKDLQAANKTFIIHFSNGINVLDKVTVQNDQLQGEWLPVPPEHFDYLKPIRDRGNRVRKAHKPAVLMAVHLYTSMENPRQESRVSLPLSSINRVDVYEYDKGSTTANHILSWVGVGLLAASAITFIAFAIACNCPQVYVNNEGQYEFKAGIFSGAVNSSLERTDYLHLGDIKSTNGEFSFRIKNFENEEQYINQVRLLRVLHPADQAVLADRHGKVFAYKPPVSPIAAVHGNTSVLNSIARVDEVNYEFDSKANANQQSELLLSFDKPWGAKTANLIINASNSKWSGYLYKEFNSLFGDSYDSWRKQQEQTPKEKAPQWQIDQGLNIRVSIETKSGWKYIDHFPLTGNTAKRNMIMELDLANTNDGPIKVKLESAFQFWNLDYTAIDFTPKQMLNQELIRASAVKRNDGKSELENISEADKTYCKLTDSDHINLDFEGGTAGASSGVSYFLVSSGYYYNEAPAKGKADLKALLKFREKGAFDEFSRQRFAAVEDILVKGALINR